MMQMAPRGKCAMPFCRAIGAGPLPSIEPAGAVLLARRGLQATVDVVKDVVDVLEAYRKPDIAF
jgi:hypothetical protein